LNVSFSGGKAIISTWAAVVVVIVKVSLPPVQLAVMVAVPVAGPETKVFAPRLVKVRAVTVPSLVTLATAGALDVHVTVPVGVAESSSFFFCPMVRVPSGVAAESS
jgi:hypothetical protein